MRNFQVVGELVMCSAKPTMRGSKPQGVGEDGWGFLGFRVESLGFGVLLFVVAHLSYWV